MDTKKTIIFGLTGGIAIYKSLNIISSLRRKGYNVHVVMTRSATEFIKPITCKTVSQNRVITEMFDQEGYVTHISLTEIADMFVVAPATANFLAKAANGIADDMLSTMYLAFKGKCFFVPSMNDNMYDHPATKKNIEILKSRNIHFMEPSYGKLATGKVGKGRFPNENDIFNEIDSKINESNKYKDKKVLVTLGATREYIDPVRFISNPSSGKMGYHISKFLKDNGAKVEVIAANYTFDKINNLNPIKVSTTKEMLDEVMNRAKDYDYLIMTAAVSDYRMEKIEENKIKKNNQNISLKLTKNPDILKNVRNRYDKLKIMGFAAETNEVFDNGKLKLEKKKLDAICINEVYKEIKGFGSDINTIIYIDKYGKELVIENDKKENIAQKIISLFMMD